MKKNVKVITIDGIRGLVFVAFIICGLISGFIVAPSFGCMYLWNYIADNFIAMPHMQIYHGAMLWGIIGLSIFASCKSRVCFGIPVYREFDEEKIKSILRSDVKNSMTSPFMDNIDLNKTDEDKVQEEIKR
ncbi:hypothetical protein IKQ26_09470 [bacterium]|nr:hypothetical protein [bacterium]